MLPTDTIPSRIAVWNTAFLGDAVLTLPLIQTLHAAFPDAQIDLYVRRGLKSLFAAHPDIHAVYEYDKASRNPMAIAAMGRQLAGRRYDLWIGAHPSARSALLAWLSRAPLRVGYAGTLARKLGYTHCVDRHFTELHEIERLLELLNPILTPAFPRQHWPKVALPDEAMLRALEFRKQITGTLIGVHPGSVWNTKRWLPAGFAEITRRAVEQGDSVMVFAGPGEEGVAREVIDLSGLRGSARLYDMSGALSLPELAAFLGVLDCYVTNDSGPMHLAWAQGTPVTALFGPTVESLGFFPRGERASVVQIPIACRPCGLHGSQHCPQGHHRCMKDILIDDVWSDVQRKIHQKDTA